MSTIDLVLVNEDENCLDVLERQNNIFSLRDLTRIENIVCTALQLIWTLLFQMLHVIMCVAHSLISKNALLVSLSIQNFQLLLFIYSLFLIIRPRW